MPNPPISLKALEAFMGHSIKETSVPFDIDRPLTEAELAETVKYCRHDVEQTVEVWLRRKEDEFDAQMSLVKAFLFPTLVAPRPSFPPKSLEPFSGNTMMNLKLSSRPACGSKNTRKF